MKILLIIIIGLIVSFAISSFQKADNIGKIIFEQNCMSCHLPNKKTKAAPSFQNIRKDYGLNWTISFLRNQEKMLHANDNRTMYSYYIFEKRKHVNFPVLRKGIIIKVLDYVDSFPDAPIEYEHRKVKEIDKRKYVKEQLKNDNWMAFHSDSVFFKPDSVLYIKEDTVQINTIRKASKRTTNKQQ